MRALSMAGWWLVVPLVLVAFAHSASAEITPEELKQRIQERADRIKEFRTLLNNPDQNIRLAALDEMTQSEDPAMREVAFEAGFRSADSAMRALALRAKFRQMTVFVMHLSKPDDASEATLEYVDNWPQLDFTITGFEEQTNKVSLRGPRYQGSGQTSGERFEFKWGYCRGALDLVDGARLEGTLACRKQDPIPVMVELM